MTGLYEFLWTDVALPLAAIERIGNPWKRSAGEPDQRTITIAGKDYELSIHEASRLLRRPLQLIPAQPSTNLCHVHFHEEWRVSRSVVVAWALCLDGEVRPVTASGVNDGLDDRGRGFPVEMPDDTVCFTGADGNSYRNIEALLDDYRDGSMKDD